MSHPQRIAVTVPIAPGVEATLQHARWAEDEGFDDVWFSDSGGIDALSLAAAIGAMTRRVRIGTAVIPVYTRTPAVFAASAYALHHACGGRFILGLGSSSQTMMEQWHGVEFAKPLTRVRETATLVRALLAGERSGFDGETLRSRGYRQPPLPAGSVPIHLAGLRGRMLELAGEVGDGAVVNLFPLRALPKIMEHIERGAARGAPGATLADREPAARDLIRRRFAPYYATPVYNRSRLGGVRGGGGHQVFVTDDKPAAARIACPSISGGPTPAVRSLLCDARLQPVSRLGGVRGGWGGRAD